MSTMTRPEHGYAWRHLPEFDLINYRMIDHWIRNDRIRILHRAHGPGERRRFSRSDVRRLLALDTIVPYLSTWEGRPRRGTEALTLHTPHDMVTAIWEALEVEPWPRWLFLERLRDRRVIWHRDFLPNDPDGEPERMAVAWLTIDMRAVEHRVEEVWDG